LLLARAVADNYVKIRKVAKTSKISASPPIFDWTGQRALLRPSIDLRDDFRINLSSRRETYVSADIRSFFHSIYTHAIPWALHGKPFAKKHRGVDQYGNLIDMLCRNAQDGQTIGLPVGPDCSRLIAESIASAVDAEICRELNIGSRDASRYVDDYTISSPGGNSGESLIAALRKAAALFELDLNNDKSAIVATSARTDGGWKQEVKSYVPRDGMDNSKFLLFSYRFGRVCEAHPETNVEKYALQNARIALVDTEDWGSIQSHLIAAYRRNSTLISFLVEIVILRQVKHKDVDLKPLAEFVDHRLPVLAENNRSGEIIWLLFLCLRVELALKAESIASLLDMDNSMIALLVAACARNGLAPKDIDISRWNHSLSDDGLRGGMWLFAYESVAQKMNPEASAKFIEDDEYFSLLFRRGVRFLDLNNGFSSVESTMRGLRAENSSLQRVRSEFAEDFEIDIDELDEEDDSDDGDDEEVEDLSY
jgi:hypothetical protein